MGMKIRAAMMALTLAACSKADAGNAASDAAANGLDESNAVADAADSAPAPAPTPAPSAAAGAWPDAGLTTGMTADALSAPQMAAIMKAAGYKLTGGKWIGCEGQSEGGLDDGSFADLNGDGHVDVIVRGSNFGDQTCYNFGSGFTILAATPTGWKNIDEGLDSPAFLKTRGKDGWPDIDEAASQSGASECATGKVRYNGTSYACLGGK